MTASIAKVEYAAKIIMTFVIIAMIILVITIISKMGMAQSNSKKHSF